MTELNMSVQALSSHVDTLKAENAKLRDALQNFLDCTGLHDDCDCNFCTTWEEARAVLAETKDRAA